jgi:hypothetical protein
MLIHFRVCILKCNKIFRPVLVVHLSHVCFFSQTCIYLAVLCPFHFGTDPDPDPRIRTTYLRSRTRTRSILLLVRILLFSSLPDKMPTKNNFFFQRFLAYYFLKVHLHQFSKIKVKKKSQNSINEDFSYFFLLVNGRIRIHKKNNGSGSGRP